MAVYHVIFIFIFCSLLSTGREIDEGFCTTAKHNATQSNLGRRFFQRMIDDENSYLDVNERNMCALMHFLFQEARQNRRSIRFLSGMFVLYDPTERFYSQLMMAKISQGHSNDHRAGFIRRPFHFAMDLFKFLIGLFIRRSSSTDLPLIYLRGDESSHFRERGNRTDRWKIYPAYGMDIPNGCMPKKFSHILFGKLPSLPGESEYRGDRIYIKPEQKGLQRFGDYLMHSSHYIRVVLQYVLCRMADRFNMKICQSDEAFHEWIDRGLIMKWTKILSTIETLTRGQRHQMQDLISIQGIREIYRQTFLFPSLSSVNDFRRELEYRYGDDIRFRKGHEIIFTTTQLLNTNPVCDQLYSNTTEEQCRISFIDTSFLTSK